MSDNAEVGTNYLAKYEAVNFALHELIKTLYWRDAIRCAWVPYGTGFLTDEFLKDAIRRIIERAMEGDFR